MRYSRLFSILASVLLLLSVSQMGIFYVAGQESSSATDCSHKIAQTIQEGNQAGNKTMATSLALGSSDFKSKVKGYNYTYSNMYNIWTWDHKTCSNITYTVNVIFTLTDASGNIVKYIVVNEDRTYSKIIGISEQTLEKSLDNISSQLPANKTIVNPVKNLVGNTITMVPISNQTRLLSPFKQFMSGISPQDVVCKPNFQLLLKLENNHPYCVMSSSVERLASHGWIPVSYSNALSRGLLVGTVTLSPCSPVERAGDPPCFGNGANYTVTVYQSDGKVAGQTRSGQNGFFRMELAPGDYTVKTPYSQLSPSSQKSNPITIIANKSTILNIVIDSGIR